MNLISARIRQEGKRVFAVLGNTQTKIELTKHMAPGTSSKREITVGIRPEHIHFSAESSRASLSGRISAIEPLGREYLLHVQTGCGVILALGADKHFKSGDSVTLGVEPDRIHIFTRRSNQNGIQSSH